MIIQVVLLWTALNMTDSGPALLQRWGCAEKEQLVGQAELLPVVLAKATWPSLLKDLGLVVYVDNNSARYGLVSGFSPVRESAELICASYALDADLGIFSWYTRVPSAANLGDGPSRLDFREVCAWEHAERSRPRAPRCGCLSFRRAMESGLQGA